MNPLVTLAVPTLNRPNYLRETLSSVLAQDYANLDILVSDNGSCDETAALVQTMIKHDRRARFRRNEVTLPAYEHLTQCVQAARGEFYVLLCDDDCITSSVVSELVSVATRHLNVSVVIPANATIDENGAVVEEFAKPEGEVFDGPEFVCQWLHERGPKLFANVSTVLARTDVLRRFGGYQGFARGRNNDNLVFLQCALTGRVGFAHDALFKCRVHAGSYGSNVTPKELAESARQFVRHLWDDPCTARALAALPVGRRKEIVAGVRYMTARELIFQMKRQRKTIWLEVLSGGVPLHRLDRMFLLVVLRQYYLELREVLGSVGAYARAM